MLLTLAALAPNAAAEHPLAPLAMREAIATDWHTSDSMHRVLLAANRAAEAESRDRADRPAAPPEPTRRITYRVHGGDNWDRIARRHGATRDQLRLWNPQIPRVFTGGDELSIWVPHHFQPLPETGLGLDRDETGLSLLAVPAAGESRGRPSRGRLSHGVRLPDNPALYLVRRPDFAYGSSHTISNLQLALAKFRMTSAFTGPLVVSDMSQRRGRRFGSHSSHQSGRDVDIWLPMTDEALDEREARPLPGHRIVYKRLAPERAHEIDWRATLALVKALIRTGEVQYIFLSRARQRHLYRAARAEGMPKQVLREVFQYPRRGKYGIVRHVPRHHKHVHVRFRCASHERTCY